MTVVAVLSSLLPAGHDGRGLVTVHAGVGQRRPRAGLAKGGLGAAEPIGELDQAAAAVRVVEARRARRTALSSDGV